MWGSLRDWPTSADHFELRASWLAPRKRPATTVTAPTASAGATPIEVAAFSLAANVSEPDAAPGAREDGVGLEEPELEPEAELELGAALVEAAVEVGRDDEEEEGPEEVEDELSEMEEEEDEDEVTAAPAPARRPCESVGLVVQSDEEGAGCLIGANWSVGS